MTTLDIIRFAVVFWLTTLALVVVPIVGLLFWTTWLGALILSGGGGS